MAMTSSKAFKTLNVFLSVVLSVVLVVGLAPLPVQRAHADGLQLAPGASLGEQATINVKIVNKLTLKKGKTRSLSSDVDPNRVWHSQHPKIASVTPSGTVTAKSVGTTIVYAYFPSYGGYYGVRLTVTGPKKVALNKKSLTLAKGKKVTLKLKNAKASKVKWTSKNKKVATVTKKGVVKARKAGKTVVTAKYQGKTFKCKVTVKGSKKIALNKKKLSLAKGKKSTLKLSNAKASKVRWTSKSGAIATVSSKGVVTAKRTGKTKVVATYKKKNYVCTVTVKGKKVSVRPLKAKTKTVVVKKNKKAAIGSLKKDGYQIILPKGAFSKNTKVKVTTTRDGKVDITAVGKSAVRLHKPAMIKIALTGKVARLEADNWWGVYRYGKHIQLIKPSVKQLRQGVLSYQVDYLTQSGGRLSTQGGLQAQDGLQAQKSKSWVESWFGGKKVSEATMRAEVAYRQAVNEASKDAQNEAVQNLLENCFGEAAKKLGYPAGSTGYDNLMKQLGKSADLMALVRSASSGDEAAFTGKATEMLTQVIVEGADDTKVGYLGAAAGSIPGVLEDVRKGDYKGASTRVAKAVAGNIPYVKAVQFTAAMTEITFDYLADEHTEAAYKAYYGLLGPGENGYKSNAKGSWDIVSTQMDWPLRYMVERARKAYAAAHGKSVKELSKDDLSLIDRTVRNTVLRQWEHRAAREKKIESRQNEIDEILKWFIAVGLMDRGDKSVDFSEYDDYQTRLDNLMHVYNAIVAMMEGKTFSEVSKIGENWLGSKQAVKDYNNENMAKLVLMWVKNGWGTGKNPVKGRLAVAKHLAYEYGMGVSIAPKTLTLEVDQTKTLKLKGNYSAPSWGSSNGKVATVSKVGEVKALKPGTVTIFAHYGKKSYECKLTVKKKQPRTVYVPGSQTVEFEAGHGNGFEVLRKGAGYNDSYDDGWYFYINKAGAQKESVTFQHPTKGLTKYVFTFVGKPYTPKPNESVIFAIGGATFNLDTEKWE